MVKGFEKNSCATQFLKFFLILILIESSLDSWILSLDSWSWFLEHESWNLILDSWIQLSSWSLKCTWFNLELILWFLRSSSLLSWSVLDFWAFCHHLCYHQIFFESILIHHEACFYKISFQKWLKKTRCRSKTIILGTPCNLQISTEKWWAKIKVV